MNQQPALDPNDLVVDLFAGGGGASTGIKRAVGRIDIAVNHSREAIAVHAANHPECRHYVSDVWEVDPLAACGGRPVGFMWASPDCRSFSRAKGGRPKSKKIRALAWVVIRWARAVRPRVIFLENVCEFQQWCRLTQQGLPDKRQIGRTFQRWVGKLRALGYVVEWREIVAADYGAPTTRKRLFLIARCDGLPIVWPEPTHGAGRDNAWRAAAEIIDWSLPAKSIFDRTKPLAEGTMRRIAAGIRRFVLDSAQPFVMPVTHGTDESKRERGVDEPLPTVTGANRGELALVTPYMTRTDMLHSGHLRGLAPMTDPLRTITSSGGHALVAPIISPVKTHGGGGNDAHSVERPLRTVTASKRGEFALVAPYLVPLNSEDGHARPRARSVEQPMPTVIASSAKHALVTPFLARTAHGDVDKKGHRRGRGEHSATQPVPTICGTHDFALVEPELAPARTAPSEHGDAVAFLSLGYGGHPGADLRKPANTVTAREHHALVAAWITKFYGTSTGSDPREPLPTVTANAKGGGHLAEVRAFLTKFYSAAGKPESQVQSVNAPMHTVTAKDRFGLVIVNGEPYEISDIRMRMLSPRELFAAQGFSPTYEIAPVLNGKRLTRTAQIRLAGNSVCPDVAAAIVGANICTPVGAAAVA